jgi:uncharacterized protein YecT (DUF1311 family)
MEPAKVTARTDLIVLVLAVSAVAAGGQTSGATKQAQPPDPCAKSTSDMERTNCWQELADKAEAQLNATYNKVLKALRAQAAAEKVDVVKAMDRKMVTSLQSVQLAWSRYRKAQCDADAEIYEGGIVEPQVRSGCMKKMAEQRTDDLQNRYKRYLSGQ